MEKLTSTQKEVLRDKIQGIIFGAALGDAVGLATEFLDKNTARNLYGKGPIKFGKSEGYEFWRDGHRNRWHENDFTDDTDQMLLILQCILDTKGILIPQHFALRLEEWTNIGFPELSGKLACGIGFTVGSTLSHSDFLTNPHKASYDIWNSKGRNLAANGAVMRTSVLGIPFFWNEIQVAKNAINCAKVTHADPRCIISSVIVSVIISRVLCHSMGILSVDPEFVLTDEVKADLLKLSESVAEHSDDDHKNYNQNVEPKSEIEEPKKGIVGTLLEKVKKLGEEPNKIQFPKGWPRYKDPDGNRLRNPVKIDDASSPRSMNEFGDDETVMELAKKVVEDYKFLLRDCAKELAWTNELDSHCFPKLLQDLQLDEAQKIGYTFKCLGSAIYSFTRSIPDDLDTRVWFKNVITELTLEAGDADTNAAVAGALLGARVGKSRLPKEWLQEIRTISPRISVNPHYQFSFDSDKTFTWGWQ